MSSLSKLDKLMYSIGVIDKVTGPVNKIMSKINQLSAQTAAAKEQMTGGLMSAAGGAMMLVGSLNPAIEAQAAMGEVSSLSVSNEALTQLNNTALSFVSNYGGNSADIIRSSYDIQSAIAGLTGKELSAFTNSSAILAKGTKSDAATTTDYFGTMYGIYQDTAKEVGKSEWINMLTGQTAASVRMFKTTGSEMAGAFSSLGAAANSHGIEMNESMAVLGQLQATMSGSEAGTKYKAFLTGVGSAQQKLGIQLTDSQGKLLPMVQVIERLKGRFGEIDTVAKSDALKNAFGSDEAVAMLKLLMPQTEQLKGNILELANITDMGVAVEMADAMSTSWNKFGGSLNAALTSLGQAVLPIIEPVVDVLSSLLQAVVWLSQEFPTLTGIIAASVVAFTGYVVIMGAFNAVMGLYRMAMLSGIALTNAHLLVTRLWQGALVALRVAGFVALIASMGTAALAMGAFKTVMLAGQAATWLFNAALWANPITWIVAGVIALIAAVAALVYYFDDITAAFNDWADSSMIFQGLRVAFDLLTLPLQLMWWLIKTIASSIYELLSPAVTAIGSLFTFLWNTVSSISSAISGFFADIAQNVIGFFSSLWNGAGGLVEQFVAYISDKFSFVTQFFSGVSNSIGGIFERITGFLKSIADNGVLNMVVSFFTGDDIDIKAKAEQLEAIQTQSRPNNFVMQNADQAFSRDYGQAVINTAAHLPGDKVAFNYAAANDDVNNAFASKAVTNTRNPVLSSAVENSVSNTAIQTANSVTANIAMNGAIASSVSNVATQAVNSVTANTAVNSAVENSVSNAATQSVNSVTANTAINSAIENSVSNAATQAVNSVTSNTAVNSAIENSASNTAIQTANSVTANTAVNGAIENNVSNAATQVANSTAANTAINSAIENSVSNAATQAVTSVTANTAVKGAIENSVSNTATQAANSITVMSNYAAANDPINTLASSAATNNYVGQSTQLTQLATQSSLQNTVLNTADNFTNAANAPVFNSSSVQLTSVGQAALPVQPLPTAKTDQVITNAVNSSAYTVDQLSNEQQQQNSSYKAKVQKSSFLQNLTRNTSYTSNASDSDNRKSVHIDSVTIKSDDLAQSFEQLMELAG